MRANNSHTRRCKRLSLKGVIYMNCYLCRIEAGNGFRPALAICQRCGAGVCEAHLVESTGMPIVGLAGIGYAIICSRCSAPFSQQRSREGRKSTREEKAWSRSPIKMLWSWLSRRGPSELPKPTEIVKEVELFLHRQRTQEAEKFREPDEDE